MNGQCTKQTAYQNAQSYKYHVRLVCRPVNIPYTHGGTFHFLFGAYHFDDITGIQLGLCQYGDFNSCPFDAADADAVHEFLPADIGYRLSGKCLFGDCDGQGFCREVEQLCVLHFFAYPVFFADDVLTAAAKYDFISCFEHSIGTYLPDNTFLAQTFHEQAFVMLLEVNFQVYHPAARLEPFILNLVGTESYGTGSVHESGFVGFGIAHLSFQILAGSFHFFQSAQEFGAEGGEYPGGTCRAENVSHGVRYGDDIDITLSLRFGESHVRHSVLGHSDDGRDGLRTS